MTLGAATQATALTLDRATFPVIGHLLSVRIGGFQGTALRTELLALLGVLVAIYLFAGFYLSVRRSQRELLEGLDELQVSCASPLADGLDAMAAGDLTRTLDPQSSHIPQRTRDELGEVTVAVNGIRERILDSIESFNGMVLQLRAILGEVSESATTVSTASQQVSATSDEAGKATGEIAQAVSDFARGAERQVTMIGQARDAALEVARAITESASSAQEAADVAQDARKAAGDGVEAAAQANEAMRAVQDSSSAAIAELAAKSQQTGKFVETITGIAQQTNLLALNAAIEAARAGDHGRGFAVVAEEVRELAEESQHAAGEIADLIESIHAETFETVEVVRAGARRTEESATIVEQTRDAFRRIGASVEDVNSRIEQIAPASQMISVSATQMDSSTEDIATIAEQSSAFSQQVSASTEETAASQHQIAASAQELASTAAMLERLVAKFKLSV